MRDRWSAVGIGVFGAGIIIATTKGGVWRAVGIVMAVVGLVFAVAVLLPLGPWRGDTGDGPIKGKAPRREVRAAFRLIDQRLEQILREAGKQPTVPTTVARAETARSWNLINEQALHEIRELEALDNMARRRRPGVSADQAGDYRLRVDRVLDTLKEGSDTR